MLALGALVSAAAALGAPGCSGGDAGEAGCQSTRTFFEQKVWSPFMGSKCTKCHTPDGTAVVDSHAKLVLQPPSYPGFLDQNLKTLTEIAKIQYEGTSELLLKPLGKADHGGGQVLDEGSADYQALKELVDRLGKSDACVEGPNTTLNGVTLLDPKATLRKAALDLVGRLPTAEENDAVAKGGEKALDQALDALLKEPALAARLRELWNDVLLTDKFLAYNGAGLGFMSDEDYPAAVPYKDGDNADHAAVNRAIAQEPLNFITYVVSHDKPFGDIVAGKYAVVNPFLAKAYGLKVSFKDPTDPAELVEAQVVNGDGTSIPHAGVLSTPAFLNRWPTSPTNRNRGRARRVYRFFLATDVLKIAERPVDATKVTATDNPTLHSPYCTVCHTVLDPVAGGFRGYDDYNYEHFDPQAKWHDDMSLPGFGGEDMDPGSYGKGLQWLGDRVAADPRFSISAVVTVMKGLTGHDPLPYPGDSAAIDFGDRLAAWEAQDAFIRKVAADFDAGGQNLKVVIKAVIESVYYRAVSAPAGQKAARLAGVGTGKLLGPEALNRKIAAVTGTRWRKPWEYEKQHDWLLEDYPILYGGIDSDAVTARLDTPNGIIAGIGARMANELACTITAYDFTKAQADRALFPFVERVEVPESAGHVVDGSVTDIKKNLVYLHERILGETLDASDPEIERSYQLFLDTWHELSAAGDTDLTWSCSGRWDPATGEDLPDGVQVKDDKDFTVRSWMAVMSYLLSDYRFLYE
ncbi:MAG: DUF1549 domain-containing protein [Byssovorax sp.]